MPFITDCLSSMAVSMMIGISARSSRFRISRRISNPSLIGMWISRRIRSGLFLSRYFRARVPEFTVTIS